MKGQLVGQFLVYVFAVVIMGVVLVMGYQFIAKIRADENSGIAVQFRSSLENDIQLVKKEYGSAYNREYFLSKDIDELCIADKKRGNPLLCSSCPLSNDYPLVVDSLSSNASSNVFLFGKLSLERTMRLDDVDIGCCDFECFDVKDGSLNLRLEGYGDIARVVGQ